jgi:hypothetical protein
VSRVPPNAPGSSPPPGRGDELEQLEELGDDAIIAQQLGAHSPQPRAQVTEEARSVVISDHPAAGSHPPSDPKMPGTASSGKRSERTEKTVVIRDRRQIEELRRQMEQRREGPAAPRSNRDRGMLLWVIVGVAAFLTGGLVALFATREEEASPAAATPSSAGSSRAAPTASDEPPAVSIDQLPIEPSSDTKGSTR